MSSLATADLDRLAEALRESAQGAQVTTNQVVINTANYIKAEMEARVPVDTGRLRQSIQIRVIGNKIIIGPDTEYDEAVEFGTGPHEIRPKSKKALAFKVGGRMVIVAKVNHPGTRAQPFVRPAFNAWVDTLGELAAEANVQKIKDAYQ